MCPAGAAEFSVGASVPRLDAVICCTGYSYHFPFLDLKVRQQAPVTHRATPQLMTAGMNPWGLVWRCMAGPRRAREGGGAGADKREGRGGAAAQCCTACGELENPSHASSPHGVLSQPSIAPAL